MGERRARLELWREGEVTMDPDHIPYYGDMRPSTPESHRDFRYRVPADLQATSTGRRKVLIVGSCLAENIKLVMEWDFGHQITNVLMNNVSELPPMTDAELGVFDYQYVQVPMRSIMPESTYFRLKYADVAGHQALFDYACTMLHQMLDAALKYSAQSGILTFVSTFMAPQQNPMGRLLERYDLRNPVYFVEEVNRRLYEIVKGYPNAHVLDVDQISATFGRMYHQDDHVWTIAHGSFLSDFDIRHDGGRIAELQPMSERYTLRSGDFLRAMCVELDALYRSARQVDQVKLVVVDLDDTLWRGVVAEEAEPRTSEGWPLGLAETLIYLKERGVLLAIASKNDEARIEGLWNDIFCGRLLLADFAVRKINWAAKVENMADILEETNLLPRSVVFIDDNPLERAQMQDAYPDMRVIGEEPYYNRRILLWSPETQGSVITSESGGRTQSIQAKVERDKEAKRMSREAFLVSLQVKVTSIRIDSSKHPRFARAFELLNKTNQFNTTGRRWSLPDASSLFALGGAFHAFEVADRFSNYGLVCVAVVSGALVEQLVMSCRVLGLGVEFTAVAEVCVAIAAAGYKSAKGAGRDTDANLLSRRLFADCGFEQQGEVWTRALSSLPQKPEHVELVATPELETQG